MAGKVPGKIAKMAAMFEGKDNAEDSSAGRQGHQPRSVISNTKPSLPPRRPAHTVHIDHTGDSNSRKLSEPPILHDRHPRVSPKPLKKRTLIDVPSDDTLHMEQGTQAVPQRPAGPDATPNHPLNLQRLPKKPLPIPPQTQDTESSRQGGHSSQVTNGSWSGNDLYESVELDSKEPTEHLGQPTRAREIGQIGGDASDKGDTSKKTAFQLPEKPVPALPVQPSSGEERQMPQSPPPVPPPRRLLRQQTSIEDPLEDCPLTRPSPAPLGRRRESRVKSILAERELQLALKTPTPGKPQGKGPSIPPRDYPKRSNLVHALEREEAGVLYGEVPLALRRRVPPVPQLPAAPSRQPQAERPVPQLLPKAPSRQPQAERPAPAGPVMSVSNKGKNNDYDYTTSSAIGVRPSHRRPPTLDFEFTEVGPSQSHAVPTPAPSYIPYARGILEDRDSKESEEEYMEPISSPKSDSTKMFDHASYYSLGYLEEKLYEPPPVARDEQDEYESPLRLLASSTGELEAPVNTIPLESLLLPKLPVSLAETELRYLGLYDTLKELVYQDEGCRASMAFSGCVQQLEIPSLDEYSRQEAVSTHRLVTGVLNNLVVSIPRVDSRFSGTVIGTGSFHDGTKIGEADEFDFMYELEDNNFQLHLHEEQSLGFLLSPRQNQWDDECDCYINLNANLSASVMAKAFANSVGQAMALVPLPQGLKHAGFCSPAYSGLRGNGPAVTIILLKGDKDRLISIDLTLALPANLEEVLRHVPHLYESWPSLVIETLEQHPVLHLIPTSGRHWRLTTAQLDVQLLQSFHDNGLVKRSIRQLKLLRERYLAIHVATKDFSMALAWMRQLVQEVVKETNVKEHTKNLLYSGMIREATLFYMFCEEHLWLTDCEFCLKDLKAIQNDLAKSLYSSWGFLDPALQIYACEIDLPLITIKSCVFKYIILDMFFKGEIRDDPDERDVALGVPDMQVICKALYLAGKDEVRHTLLGTNIQTKSLSPFAERGVPGIGSSDWKLLYNRLHTRFVGMVTSFFSETPNLGNLTPTSAGTLGRNPRYTMLSAGETDSQLRKLQEELKAKNELLAFYQKENETLKEQNSLLEMQVMSLSEQVEGINDSDY